MHPHDTTGAKPHLYEVYYKAFVLPEKENKDPRDWPCHSGVGKNAEIVVTISRYVGEGRVEHPGLGGREIT